MTVGSEEGREGRREGVEKVERAREVKFREKATDREDIVSAGRHEDVTAGSHDGPRVTDHSGDDDVTQATPSFSL